MQQLIKQELDLDMPIRTIAKTGRKVLSIDDIKSSHIHAIYPKASRNNQEVI